MWLARAGQIVLLAAVAHGSVRWNVPEAGWVAGGASVVWWLLELLIAVFPATVNIPGLTTGERNALTGVPLPRVRAALAPVCVAAGYGAVGLGAAMLAIRAGGATSSSAWVLVIPAVPLGLGVPLQVINGRLLALASSGRAAQREA